MGDPAEDRQKQVMAGLEKRQITIVGDGELAGAECPECGEQTLQIDDAADRVSCSNTNCDWDGTDALRFANVREITSAGPAQQTSNEVGGSPPPETKLGISPHISAPETPPFRATTPQPPKSSFGEHLIITALSLVFLFAGLLAAAMSGFANYQAFGSMVDDSMQARVWAWTGVIASVCSFGGFTLVYWHGAAKRFKEAARAAIFALAGAATSLVGTQMYMANTERLRTAGFESASARMPILEAQIADWQAELSGIDPSVRSVSGLEAYIAEVERVGRTNERPYRAALDELGQAQRRDALKTQIETARTDLADLAGAATSSSGSASSPLQSWFFAAMLEVFSSQGTSIGFVALMILSGRRRDDA